MSEDIRKMIDKVKNFKQFVNENINKSEEFKKILLFHLSGGNIKDSVENIEIFKQYFNDNIVSFSINCTINQSILLQEPVN